MTTTPTRKNTRYLAIWKKTYETIKKISQKRTEPMTVIVQRAVEQFERKN
jgi:hypothetical protein